MKFHHVGIATKNIEETKNKISKMMNIIEESEIIFDELQDARLCMLSLDNNFKIELIEGNVVSNFVKKRNYLYHTCYSVSDINKTIEKLVLDGALLISAEKPAILFDGKKVAFLMTDIGIVELLEESDSL